MSDRDSDDFHADLAQDRADAARSWDENGPPGDAPTERDHLVGAHYVDDMPGESAADELLGNALAELEQSPDVGPIEFQGREDYIRGETACLRGCDIVGLVPQLGSRQGYDLLGLSLSAILPAGMQRTAVRNISQSPAILQGRVGFKLDKSGAKPRSVLVIPTRKGHRPTSDVSVFNAAAVAKRANLIANEIDRRIAAAKKTGVHGYDLLGAVRRSKSAPKVTVSQAKALVADLRRSATKTADAGKSHANLAAARKAKVAAALAAGKAPGRTVNAPTGVRGDDGIGSDPFDDVGDFAEIVGEDLQILGEFFASTAIGGWKSDDPNSPDYNVWEGPGEPPAGDLAPPGTTPGAPGAAPPSYSDGRHPGPDTNYGMPPVPTYADARAEFLAPGTFAQVTGDDETTPYTVQPSGSIPYDGSRPLSNSDIGTYSYFRFKGLDGNQPQGGAGNLGGYPHGAGIYWNNNGWWQFWPDSKDEAGKTTTGWEWTKTTQGAAEQAKKFGWGPLIGNPYNDFAGLRYDESTGQYFWLRDRAPEWVQRPMIDLLLNQMVTDWVTAHTAAKTKYDDQVTQDFLDAQAITAENKRRFKEDSEIARAADLAAKARAESDLAFQQQQAQAQAQLQQQQAQTDEAAYQQDVQQQQAQAQVELQQQQAETKAYEAWLQSPQAQQPQGDGGGEGPFEDLNQVEDEPDMGQYWKQDKSEMELTANASQRDEFDGDWS